MASDLLEGAELVNAAVRRADADDGEQLRGWANALTHNDNSAARIQTALDPFLAALMARHADRDGSATYDPILSVTVDRVLARFGAWYELFPRSCADEPGRHGTFKDVEKRLPYVARYGLRCTLSAADSSHRPDASQRARTTR